MADQRFKPGNPGGPQRSSKANLKIEVSQYISFTNSGAVVSRLADALADAVREALLDNLCESCGGEMTRAAAAHIKSKLIPEIVKHPNINFYENKEYRGALGVPDRITITKLKKFLERSIKINVNACGGSGLNKSALKNLKSIVGQKSASRLLPSNIKAYMDRIVNKAYDFSSFRIGKGQTSNGRRRNWLYEANTGETKVNGYSVFPGVGEAPRDFVEYSRTGSHIMRKGGEYEPNEWRPEPSVDDVIQTIVVENIPNIILAAKDPRVIRRCLRRTKQKRDTDTARYARKNLRKKTKRTQFFSEIGDAIKTIQSTKTLSNRSVEDLGLFADLRTDARAAIREILTKKGKSPEIISGVINELERQAIKFKYPTESIGEFLIDAIRGERTLRIRER